jgi:DNA-directed RNA polymerase beta' subunit
MQLKLANINAVVENNKLKQVKTTRMFARNIQVDGLFSEEIFGKFGSNERKSTFGFVDLKTKIIHPEAYEHIFQSLSSDIGKFILNKQKYVIVKGKLVVNEKDGISGVFQFVKNFDQIDLSLLKDKKEEVNFIKQNLNKIFIDKWLILPAGIRDIQIQKGTNKSQIQYTELNELYENLIRNANSLESIPSEDLRDSLTQGVQRCTLEINKFIKERLKGKGGLIRGGLMRKVCDYSGRMVITTDNSLGVDFVGLPWQVVLRLFEPFAIHKIMKDKDYLSLIQDFLRSDLPVDSFTLKQFIKKLNSKPSIAPPLLHDYFMDVAKEIAKDKAVLIKRDPVENRNSYIAQSIRVDESGFDMKLNPLVLPRNGA